MHTLKTVDILGGGPAGLYTAILLRRHLPKVRVRVTEQNPKGATFGFGVVFSDRALDFLRRDDPAIFELITPGMERWTNMHLNHPDGPVVLDGVGFTAIGRLELIEILRAEAEALGAEVRFGTLVTDVSDLDGDLVIGADGLNSLVRRSHEAAFNPSIEYFENRFAWFGANRGFDALTQTFVNSPNGPVNAHHYRFAPDRSTFIVECGADVFHAIGFGQLTETDSAAICSDLFADVLDGASLITNKSTWRQFPRLWCKSWVAGRYVLLGDAAHTAHFSVGSGTRLALEDAIALVDALANSDHVEAGLEQYQTNRPPIAQKIVDAANTSATWYDSFGDKMALPPLDFAYDYLDRSGRMGPERMREIAPEFMKSYDAWKGMSV